MGGQHNAPIFEALSRYKDARVVPFDVPGHKKGRGNPELKAFLGDRCLEVDVNASRPLDNLCHPVSVIKEAEDLAAEAFGAVNAFFIVNGTTAAVQSMILSAIKENEKIILPRNVHRSAINALILSGAVPVYVDPQVHDRLGIPLGMSVAGVEAAIKQHPDAKAVFVNNPTYYGICTDIAAIANLAHEHNMLLLADEAHGTHFYFNNKLPVSAMKAGADMAAISMHKSGGSLTQSSLLLTGSRVSEGHVRQIINLTQTTSGSYLLLSSLDVSRRMLAQNGQSLFDNVISLAQYARDEIGNIGGYYAFGHELCGHPAIHDFDITKLSVFTRDIGLAGIEVYDILRDRYSIQIEFGDIGNILAYISLGDNNFNIERLVSSLSEIKRTDSRDRAVLFDHEYIAPLVRMSPKQAFYSVKESLPLNMSIGRVCGEFVMCYPPGIPVLSPGEEITEDILSYITFAKEKGCFMTGTEDMTIENINVVK